MAPTSVVPTDDALPKAARHTVAEAMAFSLRRDDTWYKAFLAARQLQEDEGWEDHLLAHQVGLSMIEVLTRRQDAPFLVVNGLTDDRFVWLWLSPAATAYLNEAYPAYLGSSVAVQRGYHLSIKSVEERKGTLRQVELLELDVNHTAASYRHGRLSRLVTDH